MKTQLTINNLSSVVTQTLLAICTHIESSIGHWGYALKISDTYENTCWSEKASPHAEGEQCMAVLHHAKELV